MEKGNFKNTKKYMNPSEIMSFWEANKKEIISLLSGINLKEEKQILYKKELEELEKEFSEKYLKYKDNYEKQIEEAEEVKTIPDLYTSMVDSVKQDFNMLVGIYLRRIEHLKSKINN